MVAQNVVVGDALFPWKLCHYFVITIYKKAFHTVGNFALVTEYGLWSLPNRFNFILIVFIFDPYS